jgi:NTE family protein
MSDFSHSLLDDLPEEEASRLRGALVRRRYGAGETILRAGEQPRELYILATGSVSVTCRDHHGGQRELARLGPGEWFGEMSLLTGEPASATVQAESEVEVWALPHAVFAVLTASSPLLLERLCTVLVGRLRRTNERYLQAQKAEVSLFLSPGDPKWAKAVTRAVARSLAWHSRRRVVLVELSKEPDETVFPGWHARSLQEAVRDGAPLGQHERPAQPAGLDNYGLSVVTGESPAPPASQVMPVLESLRNRYDYVLIYAGCDHELGRAIAQSAALALLLVRKEELGLARGPAAALGLVDGRCDVGTVVVMDGLSAPTIGELERLQKTTPLTLRCLVPGGVGAVEALAREEGQAVPGLEAARNKVDWLARDIGHLKVGLALGGGGSRGYAHLGVLKVLQRCGMPIDVAAGCSIGAAVAAGVAAGYTLERIKRHMDAAGRKAIRLALPLRSLLSSQGVVAELQKIAGERRFEDLSTPLGLVAADVLRGEEVLLCRGPGWPAMAASMALPGIYPPVRIGYRYLVDGGVVNPVPVSAAVALGADLVVGVKLGALRGRREVVRPPTRILRGPSILDTITGTLETMQRKIVEMSSSHADVTIEPQLPDDIGLLDFRRGPELMDAGERAAEQALPQLRAAMPWLA